MSLRECPHCHQKSTVDSPFCPACGAPMSPHAVNETKNYIANASNPGLMTMKWHKFLKYVSIPLSIVMLLYQLYQTIPELRNFDPARYFPQVVDRVRLSLTVEAVFSIALIPLLLCLEWGLIKMRWYGVVLLLTNYALQAANGIFSIVLFLPLLEIPDVNLNLSSLILSEAEMVLMFFLNLVYYRKRRGLFSPSPASGGGGPEGKSLLEE